MYSETQYGWETTWRATPASAWRTPTSLLPSCHLAGSRLRPLATSCKSGSELKSLGDSSPVRWASPQEQTPAHLKLSCAISPISFQPKGTKEKKKDNDNKLIITLNQNLLDSLILFLPWLLQMQGMLNTYNWIFILRDFEQDIFII